MNKELASSTETTIHENKWSIVLNGKQHIKSKNAANVLKNKIRSCISNNEITKEELEKQNYESYAKEGYELLFSIEMSKQEIYVTIKEKETVTKQKKLKQKLHMMKNKRKGVNNLSSSEQSYQKLLNIINSQPNGKMLESIIPTPQKLAETPDTELNMQISLFKSLPINGQLKDLILNYYQSKN